MKIPLMETLKQMTGYAKFITNLVTKKWKVSVEPADNMHHCNAIASQSLVEKAKIFEL